MCAQASFGGQDYHLRSSCMGGAGASPRLASPTQPVEDNKEPEVAEAVTEAPVAEGGLQIVLSKKQADASEPSVTTEVTCPLPPPPLYLLS